MSGSSHSDDVEASYQEYLRQCELQRINEENNSSAGTNDSSSAMSTAIDALSRLAIAPVRNTDFAGLGRGRGRGRARVVEHDLSSPELAATSTATSPTLPLNGVERFNLAGIGLHPARGRGRSSGAVALLPESNPLSQVPLPIVNPIRGRGRGTSRQYGLTAQPGLTSPGRYADADGRDNPGIGTETFSNVEREIVVRKGEKGLMIPVTANFVRISVTKGCGLFMYHVDFEPVLDSVRLRRSMLRDHELVLGKVRTFDGAKLFLPYRLPNQLTVLKSVHPNDPNLTVKTIIRFIRENRMSENVHFYNILFRRIMEKLGLQEINRHFYDYRARYRLPLHRLEIWPGYVTAVDELEGGLLLCCDVSHRVLRTATLLDVYNDMYYQYRDDPPRLRQVYSEYVVSKIVLTTYNRKNYRVDDVDYSLSPKSTFQLSSGETISYVDYYKQHYNITITDLEQPLIIHRPKPDKMPSRRPVLELVCLIPECCNMTGLTEDLKKDHKIMRDIAEFTRVAPHRRTLAIKEFVKSVKQNPEAADILESWGLALEDASIELPARRIAPPHIVINPDRILKKQFDFNRELAQNPCLEPIAVRNWMVFCTSFDRPKADAFVENYFVVCRNIGIDVSGHPQIIPINGQQRRLVENYARAIMEHLKNNLQFIVVIVPSEIGELYEAIKKICCIERPIPSQVILAKTLSNERQIRSIVSKIALQINCKLGGALWTIRIPLGEKIMFVGMDVYHDPKRRNPSVLALVASLNEMQTKYFSRIVEQRSHQEISDSLRGVFTDCLHTYHKHSGALPDRIVVFRDGVGDGQLEITRDTEVVQMLEVLKSLYGDVMPKFTFTVVQKRISCRIYGRDPETGNFVNAPSGTVLDHTVTRKYLYDFFLVSQIVLQGTVSPTHYIVLEDQGNVAPDLIQKFAFATSFLYYNWAAPIRVPAVCQYAHKLAFLVGQYVKEAPSHALSCQLYYL